MGAQRTCSRRTHTYIFSSVRTKLFVGCGDSGRWMGRSAYNLIWCYYRGLLFGRDTGSGTTFLCPVWRGRVRMDNIYDCFRFADVFPSLFVVARHGIDTMRKHMFIMDVHDFECRWIWSQRGRMCTEWVDNKEEAHTKNGRDYSNDVCMFQLCPPFGIVMRTMACRIWAILSEKFYWLFLFQCFGISSTQIHVTQFATRIVISSTFICMLRPGLDLSKGQHIVTTNSII